MTHQGVGQVPTDAPSPETESGNELVVGERAFVDKGVTLGHRVRIGANATVVAGGADPVGTPVVEDDVVIGPGAVVVGAVRLGVGSRVESGAVVTQDVPPHAVVAGNPAIVVGYGSPPGPDSDRLPVATVVPPTEAGSVELLGGASLVRFSEVQDLRGRLTFAEYGHGLPFTAQRVFFVHDVPSTSIRGEHAHRTLHEFLICVAGSVCLSLTDGLTRQEVVLDDPSLGVHLPPYVWSTQFRYQAGSVLAVLCSEPYDPASYIRDYGDYLREVR